MFSHNTNDEVFHKIVSKFIPNSGATGNATGYETSTEYDLQKDENNTE